MAIGAYNAFLDFKNFEIMDKKSLDLAIDHICLNLNNPGVGYKCFYDMYSYAVKCKIVLQKYEKTKLGEAICDGKLVNFLDEPKHRDCCCGSVYYNAVFD